MVKEAEYFEIPLTKGCRYALCTKHGLPSRTVEVSLPTMEAAKASLSPAIQVSVGECRYRDATASLKGDAAMSVVDEEYWDPDPHDLNEVFVVMEVCISRKGLERIGYEAVHLSNDEMHAIVSKLQKNIDIDLVRALLDSSDDLPFLKRQKG